MGKNEVSKKKLNSDEEKKILREFQIPDGEYYEITYGNNWVRAVDCENYLIYISDTGKGKNDEKFIDVQINGMARRNNPYKKRIRYDVTNGTENARMTVEELSVFDGPEELRFIRRVVGSEDIDGTLTEDHDSTRTYYIVHDQNNYQTYLTIIFNDEYRDSDFQQSMYVGIPSDYVHPSDQFVRPRHTLYRIGEKGSNLNIALESQMIYVSKDDTLVVRGFAFEKFNEDLYKNLSKVGIVEHIFREEDLSQAKSALLYASYKNALKVLKKDTCFEIAYGVVDTNGNVTFDDSFILPCLSPDEITEAEIDIIIADLQNRYPDEKFIAAVVIELEKFQKEIIFKRIEEPHMMTNLGRTNLKTFNSEYILNNKDDLFQLARNQYNEMLTNSLTEKQYH